MIVKKAFIELIRERISGEYASKQIGKVGDRKLAYYIGRAYNSALISIYARNLTSYDPYTREYTNVAIDYDSNTEMYYSTLPAKIIILPRRAGNGVMWISGMTSKSVEFVPITNGHLKVMDGLEVDQLDDVIGYVYRNGRIEYWGMTSAIAADDVRMGLVIPFEEYDMEDEVPLPVGADEMIMQSVVQFLLGTPDADKVNDSNSLNKNMVRNG